MSLRKKHGRALALTGPGLTVEICPVDELPAGVPGDARGESPHDRGEGGRFAGGNTLARQGGLARQGKTRLAERLGLRDLPEDAAFRPYKASAVAFRRAHCNELARTVGGGVCGPGPSSIVASAAMQLAWSRFLSDRAAETDNADMALQASRLANDSRQNLIAAHELCAREAEGRARRTNAHDPLAKWKGAT